MYDTRKLAGTIVRLMLSVLSMFYLAHATANECLNLMPYDVKTEGSPKICQSNFSGIKSNYACQDYRSGESRYRVLYKGGRHAQAVLALNANGQELILSSSFRGDEKLDCPLNAPANVPEYATHRGMGVCRDEGNMPIVCSIFQYAAAREPATHLYMVYYPNQNHELTRVDVEDAGANKDAMVAEIAYQIGQSLLKTSCCSDRAMQYIAYAYHLFPRSETYRLAYQHSRALLALGNY